MYWTIIGIEKMKTEKVNMFGKLGRGEEEEGVFIHGYYKLLENNVSINIILYNFSFSPMWFDKTLATWDSSGLDLMALSEHRLWALGCTL